MAQEKFNAIVSDARSQASETLAQAREQGEVILKEATAKAAVKASEIMVLAQEDIRKEQALAEQQIRTKVVDLAVVMAEKILGKKFDEQTDKKYMEDIIK